MYEQIIYEVDDPAATITLNRPKQLNAWTQQMAAEVKHAIAWREWHFPFPSVVIFDSRRKLLRSPVRSRVVG